MAIGLGRMLGFNFLDNFDYPYISKTITEFWRRWHISLGTWFRDYVYFPLGGSKVHSKLRLVFNLFVVWVATGIWHGAKWNFLLWGLMYFAIIAVEKLLSLPKWLKGHKMAAVLYQGFTLLVVVLGWVVFRAENLPAAKFFVKSMFGMAGNAFIDGAVRFNLREYFTIFVAGCLCATPVFKVLKERISSRGPRAALLVKGAGYAVQLLLFVVSVSSLVMNAHNPFIYFNF
jgi:D-alanyl-lipoteichoic acid acyltransferase DltB (MBOAT superfamily)